MGGMGVPLVAGVGVATEPWSIVVGIAFAFEP